MGLEGEEGVRVGVKKKWGMAEGKGRGDGENSARVIELVFLQLGEGGDLHQGQWLKGEDLPTNV